MNVDLNKKNFWKGIFSGILIGAISGLFGGGGGMIAVVVFSYFFQLKNKESHSTAIPLMLVVSVCASFAYLFSNKIDVLDLILVCVGEVLGGVIGAKILPKIPNQIIQLIFSLLMIIAGAKGIIFS